MNDKQIRSTILAAAVTIAHVLLNPGRGCERGSLPALPCGLHTVAPA